MDDLRAMGAPDACERTDGADVLTAPAPTRDMQSTILQAAATLFAERGYNATSVRDIVARAGCTKPTLYYYFKNKEHLFVEAVRLGTDTVTGVIEAEVQGSGTVRHRLHRALEASLRFVDDNPTLVKLTLMAERHPEQGQPHFDFESLHQYQLTLCCNALREAAQNGQLRQGLDIEEAALALFGMVDHRLGLHLSGKPLPKDYPKQVLDLFFNGVCA